jgi:hypothetical protein
VGKMVILTQNTTISCQKLVTDCRKNAIFSPKIGKKSPKILSDHNIAPGPCGPHETNVAETKKKFSFFLPSHGRLFLSKKCFDCQHIKWLGQHDFLVTSHFLDVLTKKKFA